MRDDMSVFESMMEYIKGKFPEIKRGGGGRNRYQSNGI